MERPLGALPQTPVIVRQRLTEHLACRFTARLTVVVGGGGSGKTTALAHALSAEVNGVDVWYPCTTADADADRLAPELLVAVEQALDVEPADAADAVDALCEHVLGASPRQVCVVLDDAHLLGRSAVVARLLERLPNNGHVLLAGRRRPELDVARLDAGGQLVEMTQDELLMTDEEQVEFAATRGIDVEVLSGTDGWPALVELASKGGGTRSRRYLESEAVATLPAERRRRLAAFALVGGGDDEIAWAVTGQALDALVDDLPLVRWSGAGAQLHDIWSDLLAGELDEGERTDAAVAAARIWRERSAFDRAVDLAAAAGSHDDVREILGAAVLRGVDGGLRHDQLVRWRGLLPNGADGPIVALLDGLIERERDPTGPAPSAHFDRAATGFAEAGEAALELVALAQLGYLCRVAGDAAAIGDVMSRIADLADAYAPARPFLAFGDAWKALTVGRPDLQLAAMERIEGVDLPAVWRITRDHLAAHALYNLGRPTEALARAPRDIDDLPVPIPGALVTLSQCYWAAGRPDEAIEAGPAGLSAKHGARDRFIAGVWLGMMHAFVGHVDDARRALDVASAHTGTNPSPMMSVQLAAVEMLVTLAQGREDDAAAALATILEQVPLGGGVGEQLLRNAIPVPYTLVPDSRPYWDAANLGPSHLRTLELARAFTAARERDDLEPLATLAWPDPATVACRLPTRWAVELALHATRAGRHEGRHLLRWLCEHWGDPARNALRSWTGDETLGEAARELLATTPTPPAESTTVAVLGLTRLHIDGLESADPNWRRERVRALLVLLVLRRSATRDQLAGALWPDLPIERAARNLRTTLNYLHGVLEPRRSAGDAPWFVRIDGQHVYLHDELDVDLWHFDELLDEAARAERDGRVSRALSLLVEATGCWNGELAADLDHDWLDLERIHVRSRFVQASARAAELLVATGRAAEAIELLRPALTADPWNERNYLATADAYAAIGDLTSARAILAQAEERIGELTIPAGRRLATSALR